MKTYNIFIKNYLYVGLISLLSLIIIECNSPKDKNKASDVDDLITLMNLDINSSPKLWDQFFTERGAQSIWQQLQNYYNKKTSNIEFSFNSVTKSDLKFITEEKAINDIAAGIIKYIVCHEWKVKILDLKGNNITEIPSEIGKLTSLVDLNLTYNQLVQLPSEIGNLINLKSLYLTNNKLTKLPNEIGNLSNLDFLSLGDNSLIEIPTDIGKLSKLEYLNLSNNELSQLPASMVELNIRLLSIDGNQWISPNDPTLKELFFKDEEELKKFIRNHSNQKIHATKLIDSILWHIQNNLGSYNEEILKDIASELNDRIQQVAKLGLQTFEDLIFFKKMAEHENIPFVLNNRLFNSEQIEETIKKIIIYTKDTDSFQLYRKDLLDNPSEPNKKSKLN